MTVTVAFTGYACADCIIVIANADTSGITDVDAWQSAVDATDPTAGGRYVVVPGDDEIDFGTQRCRYCGTWDAGYRHEIAFLSNGIDPRDVFALDDVDLSETDYAAFRVFVTDLARGQFDDVADAYNAFRDAFIGDSTVGDYAYDYAHDVLGLTGVALDYFDAGKFGRDLVLSGDVIAHDGFLFNGTW
jgi:hypothetical protein